MTFGELAGLGAEFEDIVVLEAVNMSLLAFAGGIRHHHLEIKIADGDCLLFPLAAFVLGVYVALAFAHQRLFLH